MKEKNVIQYYIKRLYDKGLTTMSGGNLSIRTEKETYVTPAGIDKGLLKVEDIMKVYPDGREEGKHKVTSEFKAHQSVYKTNPDKNAVLHAHTTSILGFSAAHRIPNVNLTEETCLAFRGRIGIAPYAQPGTQALGDSTAAVLDGSRTVAILENHGLFIVDNTMEDCFDDLEKIDLAANIERNIGKLGGKCVELSEEQYQMLFQERTEGKLWQREKTEEFWEEKTQIVDFLQRAYRRGISTSKNMCFSIRTETGSVLVNPADTDVMQLVPEEIVVVRGNTYAGSKPPHKDLELHRAVYDGYLKTNSIITARPPCVMAYGCSDCEYSTRVIPECYGYLRDIQKLDFAVDKELKERLKHHFDDFNVSVLVKNRFYMVTAPFASKAYDRLEVAESTADALVNTAPVSAPVEMDEKAVEEMNKVCGISRT